MRESLNGLVVDHKRNGVRGFKGIQLRCIDGHGPEHITNAFDDIETDPKAEDRRLDGLFKE